MKKITFWKSLFLLCALIVGNSSAWGQTETAYTFSSKSWAASPANWSGTADGNQFNATNTPLGVQVTTGKGSGATITSPKSFTNVTKVVVTYSSSSKAVGSIEVFVGSTSLGSKDVSKSQTEETLEYSASNLSGNVSFVPTVSTNSIGINSITITEAGGSPAPSISANDVPIAYNATNGSIAYTINNAPTPAGTLTAAIKTGTTPTIANFDLGTATSSAVPFTCTANTSVTAKTATVTLTYTYNTNETVTKDVTITQAADPNAFNAITDITASGTSYKVKGTVVATNARGFVTGDGTGYIYYYKGSDAGKSVGDILSIDGTTGTYGQVLQFTGTPTITTEEASNYDGNPAVSVVTTLPDYSSGLHLSTYLQFEGTLAKNNSNYEITVGSKIARISYPTTAQTNALEALLNKTVRVKGYFAGNSSSIFTVMLESVEEVVVDAHTLTVNATNGSVAIKDKTLDSNNQCEVAEDAEVEATATPAEHYTFTSWSATGVTLADATANPLTFTMPTNDVTLTANFTEMAKHTATFYVQGVAVGTDANVYEGEAITFPTNITVPTGYTLMGWTTAAIAGEQNTAPATLVTAANMGTTDVSYHAVFAIGSGSAATLTKMTGSDTFASDDKVVVVAEYTDLDNNTTTNYAMYQENASVANYVNKWVFDNNVETVAADNKKWFTVSTGSTSGTWTLGDATNGYVYTSGSNNLSVSTENATDFTLTWNSTKSKFVLVGNSRWLSYRSDLDNKYFRMGGATTGTAAGIVYFDIYKYDAGTASYSNYCTTVPETGTITLNAACNDGKGNIYGTYFTNRAYEMPATLKGSVVSVDNYGELVVDAVYDGSNDDVVPANTALLISTTDEFTGTKDYTITYSTGGDDYSEYNMLKGTLTASETTTGDNCLFYRLTMHNGTTIGFYWGAENGAAFTPGANKAYLAVPTALAAKMSGFAFDDTTTGINGVEEIAPVTKTRKVVKNGRLVIETANGEFTIDGARMK